MYSIVSQSLRNYPSKWLSLLEIKKANFLPMINGGEIKGKRTFFFLNTDDCIWMTRVKVEIFNAFLIPTRMNAKSFSLHLHHHCPFSKLHFGYKLLSNMLLWCQNLGIICSLICIIEYIYITSAVSKNLFLCVSQILLHVMSTKVWQRKCNTSPMGTKRHVRRGRRKVLQWLYYTKALPFHSFILLLEKCIIVVQLR